MFFKSSKSEDSDFEKLKKIKHPAGKRKQNLTDVIKTVLINTNYLIKLS